MTMVKKMLKLLAYLLLLSFLCSTVAGQQSSQIFTLQRHDSTPENLQQVSHSVGVSVDHVYLNEVSTSILLAEKWLRTHVLSHYPATNITFILVAHSLLCNKNLENQEKEEILRSMLHSMKNIHHSLVRWGLQREIKVSVSLPSECLHQSLELKPLFIFLEDMNSTYTINLPHFSDETLKMLTSHLNSMRDLGVFHSKNVNVIFPVSKQPKPTSRKLSFIDTLPTTPSQIGYSVPSDAATTPLPPLIGVSSPTPLTLPFAPESQPPMMGPMSSPPHYGFNLPPCNPYPSPHHGGATASPPVVGGGGAMAAPPAVGSVGGGYGYEQLWCVAKPSVPSEKLQEALDYACGAGGADCGAISPSGSCYSPDSVVAHASYAFNSYWQKNKRNGGTCGFGGTAMLINSDPSFLHCRFILS